MPRDGLSPEKATIVREANTIKITFADSEDAITIHHAQAKSENKDGPAVTFQSDGTIRIT